MSYMPSINNLTGEKPQGYTPISKDFGKPAKIATSSAMTKAIQKKADPRNGSDQLRKMGKSASTTAPSPSKSWDYKTQGSI